MWLIIKRKTNNSISTGGIDVGISRQSLQNNQD